MNLSIKKTLYEISMIPRYLTATLRGYPDFLIIGTQKGGTSSLFKYLMQHPNILASARKQVHYFDMNYSRGKNWYRSFFPFKRQLANSITGEASPFYMYHKKVPKRVYKLIPNVKIICLLRNPTQRTISHINHNKRLGIENNTVEEILSNDLQKRYSKELNFSSVYEMRELSYISRSVYLPQVERWKAIFNENQLYFLRSEDLFYDTKNTLKNILKFLGYDLNPKIGYKKVHNKNNYPTAPKSIVAELNAFFEPYNDKLRKTIGEEFVWDNSFRKVIPNETN